MREVAVDVVDVQQKENGSEHAPLNDTCFDLHPLRCRLTNLNSLPAVAKVCGNPFDQPHWKMFLQLDEQLVVGHKVERFSEVKEDR